MTSHRTSVQKRGSVMMFIVNKVNDIEGMSAVPDNPDNTLVGLVGSTFRVWIDHFDIHTVETHLLTPCSITI